MDYEIGKEPITCGQSEAQDIEKKYKLIQDGKNFWLYPTNVPNSADYIYYCDSMDHSGFGGSQMTFQLENLEIFKFIGPWHSNSGALKSRTGIDLTQKHLTYVVIGEEIEHPKCPNTGFRNTVIKDVIYWDKEPTIGSYHRGEIIAREIAKERDSTVVLYSKSNGGSMITRVNPDSTFSFEKR